MNNLLANPETTTLLQGLKPYLGQKGTVLTDGILKLMEIATSDIGRELIKMLGLPPSLSKRNTKTITLGSGKDSIALDLPFILFLVFVLLMFSGNTTGK